jgi:hypothetical protein
MKAAVYRGESRVAVESIPVPEIGAGELLIRVEACGICHTDAATVTGIYPGLTLPRVPGHEVVGRIEAIGSGVSRWKIGQRVGVGFFGGEDGVCEPCRRGDTVNCRNPVIPGITVDGGYAEVMVAESRGLASIPDDLTSAEAAPLLCAGLIGGLGIAPGMNLGDGGIAIFEATHGSAPKYKGQNKANPMAQMLSGVYMLHHLGEAKAGDRLERAIALVILENKSVTYDMKEDRDDPTAVGTSQVADAVIEKLRKTA